MKSVCVIFLALLLGGCAGSQIYIGSDIPIIAKVVGEVAVKLHGQTDYCKNAVTEQRVVRSASMNGNARLEIVHTCIKE